MGIWNYLFGQQRGMSLLEISERASSLIIEQVRPLVENRIGDMGVHEARGYVRARAGHLLRDAIDIVVAHDPPHLRYESNLMFSAVLEEVLRSFYRRATTTRQLRRRAA